MKRLTLVNISREFESGNIPLGLVSIASYLKKYGGYKEITLLDSNFQDIYQDFRQTDIVGISAVTQVIKEVWKIKKNFRSIGGVGR